MISTHPAWQKWLAILVLTNLAAATARAQPADSEPLRLNGLFTTGARNSVTESWGTLRLDLSNSGPEGREARVVAFYPEQPEVQFSRDVFVPGRSSVYSWLPIGPAPKQKSATRRDIRILLYDRTGGRERLIPSRGEGRVDDRPLFYLPREPTTVVLLDQPEYGNAPNESRPDALEPVDLARSLRDVVGLSERVGTIQERFLPGEPEAYDGIDVLVLAGNRIGADPAGRQALRRWVQQGGTLWILLDRVDSSVAAPFLGDDFDIQPIDRVTLTSIRMRRANDDPAAGETRDLDHPVEFVRYALGETDTVIHKVDDWPASFVRTIGRGQVICTTLGARGWYQPRTARDARSRFEHFPDSPIPLNSLAELAQRVHPRVKPSLQPPEALREMVIEGIGYSVVGRSTVALIFAGFLVGVLGLGLALRRSKRPGLIGWLSPVLALATAATFVALGEASRRSVPATIGIAAIVEGIPGSDEAAVYGYAAVYRPTSGLVPLGTDKAAQIELNDEGLEGQTRRRVVTDLDAWHWDDLGLPAGVRTGPFRSTMRKTKLSAAARFGPEGVVGRFETGRFIGPRDGLLLTPARESLPVRFGDGGAFAARSEDALPPGQFLTAAVLTDQQQRRHATYRELLGESFPKHWEGRNLLLAWADSGELPFRVNEGDRLVGSALLVVPIEFERPEAGTHVTIPRAFITITRMVQGRPQQPVLEGTYESELDLYFQLPPSVLPLSIERARLTAKVRSPGRKVSITGQSETGPVPLFDAENPLDPIEIDITDPRMLRLDSHGKLRIKFRIGEQRGVGVKSPPPQPDPQPGDKRPDGKGAGAKGGKGIPQLGESPKAPDRPLPLSWKIESLGLEVIGNTSAGR